MQCSYTALSYVDDKICSGTSLLNLLRTVLYKIILKFLYYESVLKSSAFKHLETV